MEGLNCKNGKISQKRVFIVLAKHGLKLKKKNLDKSIWSLILRDQKRREEEKRKREEEEEEEKKKRREEEIKGR